MSATDDARESIMQEAGRQIHGAFHDGLSLGITQTATYLEQVAAALDAKGGHTPDYLRGIRDSAELVRIFKEASNVEQV